MNQGYGKTWSRKVAPVLFGAMAAILLLWGIGDKYLWQDEAQTAVLAQRMMRFGRPLAYDGVNLITVDQFVMEDPSTVGERTGDPRAAVEYYVKRGDLKADSTWRWQPWGQFVVEAASLKLLGATTLAARLPFALAGIATVVLWYGFVLARLESPLMASLTALLLVLNTYWILHGRQARYYSLSSLLLVVTVMAYARWQWSGGRWGAAAFVAAAWCWFQVDYGTWWPVLLVLFGDALVAQWRRPGRVIAVGLALAATLAPFAYYLELWRRFSKPAMPWGERLLRNLFNMNEYVLPLLILVTAMLVLGSRWKTLGEVERRLMGTMCATAAAFTVWVPLATPASYLRYVIIIMPVAALVAAWTIVKVCGSRTWLAWGCAALLLATPCFTWLIPPPRWYRTAALVRPELAILGREVFGHTADPNRVVIEWLRKNAAPTDEILINYEDVPLMFYLPNPVRGGVAAFRAEDDSRTPPAFLILRHSVKHVHWPVFEREAARYRWQKVELPAPDVPWGNSPDPIAESWDVSKAPEIYVGRRIAPP